MRKGINTFRFVSLLVGACCLIQAWALRADDAPRIEFVNGNGSGDLASGSEYAGGVLPDSTDTVLLTKNYGMNLMFSKSVTFEDIFIAPWADYTTNTIAITDPLVKVTLKGEQDSEPGIHGRGAQFSSLTLRGGIYDFNGRGNVNPSRWGYNYAEDALILDGVVATNVYRIAAVCAGNNDVLKVTNGSRIYVKEADCLMDASNDARMLGGYAEFSGGSRMVVSDTPIQPIVRGMTNATFVITGEGTELTSLCTTRDARIFAVSCSNNVIRVEDGAVLDLHAPSFCGASSVMNNRIEIRSGGVVNMTGSTASFSGDTTASGNAIEVLEDGVLSGSGEFNFRGRNNILVDNGRFELAGAFCNDAIGGCLRILGENASFSYSGSCVFMGARESTVEFGNNSQWYKDNIYFANGGCSNAFVVTDGAAVSCVNFKGRSYGSTSTFGNRMLIKAGGKLTVSDDYSWSGWDNATIISNGTLECVSMNLGDRLDREGERDLTSLNNCLVFQGDAPSVKASGNCYMHYGPVVRFELPHGGYPSGTVLWSCSEISYWNGEPMKLEIAGLDDDFVASLDETLDVTLIKTESSSLKYYLEDQVKALAPTLHPRAKLYFDCDNTELHLKVKAKLGLTIILK